MENLPVFKVQGLIDSSRASVYDYGDEWVVLDEFGRELERVAKERPARVVECGAAGSVTVEAFSFFVWDKFGKFVAKFDNQETAVECLGGLGR